MTERVENGRVRETYELAPGVEERLEELRVMTAAKDRTEVIRKALRALDWVVCRRREGFSIQVVKEGESVTLDLA
jgi:hypothetical protein